MKSFRKIVICSRSVHTYRSTTHQTVGQKNWDSPVHDDDNDDDEKEEAEKEEEEIS